MKVNLSKKLIQILSVLSFSLFFFHAEKAFSSFRLAGKVVEEGVEWSTLQKLIKQNKAHTFSHSYQIEKHERKIDSEKKNEDKSKKDSYSGEIVSYETITEIIFDLGSNKDLRLVRIKDENIFEVKDLRTRGGFYIDEEKNKSRFKKFLDLETLETNLDGFPLVFIKFICGEAQEQRTVKTTLRKVSKNNFKKVESIKLVYLASKGTRIYPKGKIEFSFNGQELSSIEKS